MYLGPLFPPLSLVGLLLRGSTVTTTVPGTMVSVIIPVHNGERTIEKCIKSVKSQSLRPFEIIVVDDYSTDKTSFILGRLSERISNLKVIRNEKNLGKAASVERGLEHVHSPYVAIVDSDTYLDRDYFKNILGSFIKGVVGASGTVLPAEDRGEISKSRLIEYLQSQSTYKKIQTHMGAVFVCPGCCSVWRTEWIKKNGIPKETVVEDMDLTWEAQIDGGKIAYVPEALAYTEEPENFRRYIRQISRWLSWRPVLEKHSKRMTNGLKIMISWMLAESVGYVIWMGLLLYFLLSGMIISSLILLFIDLSIITFVCIYQGSKINIPIRKIISSLPYYYAFRMPTAIIFWKSFFSPKRNGW
ncbi:MAG: glycosyltransferase family 2 protein [Candidatus Bathyarchaeia archaeon]